MEILPSLNLKTQYQQRLSKTIELETKIEKMERELKEVKSTHANAMMELCKMNIYKQKAKHSNNNIYFEWMESEREQWNAGKKCNFFFWDYETPTMNFKIKIKERSDLKIWKYEVHVSGTKVHFESFELLKMYERNTRNGWSMGWTNFLKDYYCDDTLIQKFKTFEDSILQVVNWKRELKNRFSYEINYDKNLYLQACNKYIDTIYVQLNYECAKFFYEEIETYHLEVTQRDYWNVEISGENAKQIVKEIKNKHNMSLVILAG